MTRSPAPALAALAVGAVALALMLGGCTSSAGPTVPVLATVRATSGSGTDRVAAIHAVAECIRSHGAPTYSEPVLDAEGHVYSDRRSLDNLSRGALSDLEHACGSLAAAAGFSPSDEPPAPPALVAAGVRSAQCLRQNGMPDMHDPTSRSTYTPGHGFGLSAQDLPNRGALGKADPAVQRAFHACRTLLDAEIRASELTSLAKD
ncbi:hypothetical protein [Leifsonia sp. EB34]|uniref:hypothetical protein n=1 Tax=Leifsonia sp. EB34 TaxID=3156303 RepID=UPI0035181C4F